MNFTTFLTLAAALRVVIAQNATALAATCPLGQDLEFNSTNVAALAPCTQLNFLCPINSTSSVFEIYNTSTTGPAPSDCEPYNWLIWIDNSVNGSFSIPGVVNVSEARFQGQSEAPLNLTSFAMPDLTTTFFFVIEYADTLQSLSLPVLSSVGVNLFLSLTGESPPAINLSFPSLKTVGYSISLFGNIDEVDLPVLTSLLSINITSTGNLDCEALAKKVVNATPASNYITDSVICNSNLASVTTHRAVPTATATAPAHSGGSLGVQRGSMLWIALLGCFLFLL